MKSTAIISLVLLTVGFPTASGAVTRYVKPDGSGSTPTIQAAIDASANGDTVLLAAGTFVGVGNRDLDFKNKRIVMRSESGPHWTIINCGSAARGLKIDSGQGSETVVRGITIKNGFSGGNDGGGIFINNTSPTIEYNIIVNNVSGRHGGGIFIKNGSPAVRNNTVAGNSANNEGGGITVEATAFPFLSNNIVVSNTASGGTGGIACRGGGTPFLSCNDVWGNGGGGGDALCGNNLGNNMSSAPQFCGITGSGNYYLQSDSPCAPFNNPCSQLIGALDVQCGTVSTEHQTWGGIKALYH